MDGDWGWSYPATAVNPLPEPRPSSSPNADAAMDRYAAGDDAAFGELYDHLAPRMYRFVLRKVHNVAQAEDLVQQALLQLHRARGRFVAGSLVMPWAFAILQRLYIDQVKRKKLELLSPDGNVPVEQASRRPDPEEDALRHEQVEILLATVLSTLTPVQREAFELVHHGQMTHAEVAALLGTSVATVKLRLQRAHVAIRIALDAANGRGAR